MAYNASDSRYLGNEFCRTGNSGLFLPPVSLGLWHNFGSNDNFDNMKQMCFTAFDNGITHFDIANNYGPIPGSAEENFGKIMREELMNYRDEMIISTKAGYYMWQGPYGDFGSRKYMLASLDQSLKRLGLQYVDIFYHHRMDKDSPLEESMMALDTAVKSGKALYAGISNYDGKTMKKAAAILKDLKCPFIINQNRYSMIDRSIEYNGLKASAEEDGTGIIVFSPLAQGLLAGRYKNGIPSGSRATKGVFLKESSITNDKMKMVEDLYRIALQRDQTLAQLALSWVLKDGIVTSALIGASSPAQILENIKAANNTSFTEKELAEINIICGEKG